MEHELRLIHEGGYAPLFLVVADIARYAREAKIPMNTRGSVANSLVAYAMGITNVDPMEHELLFERFLNPERKDLPDIDLDFADNRRDEVIDYVIDKYGQERVAHIITFGRMEARAAVRDIGRVLGMPYAEPDKIAKLIPFNMSLKQALETVPELEKGLGEYFTFYNHERPHQSLSYQTPAEVHLQAVAA